MEQDRISRAEQVKIYTGKCFRLFVYEKQWKNFISTLIIMALISLVTGPDMFRDFEATRKGAFAIVCACIWVGLFNSIQSICRERAIIKREHRTGLHISSYIRAHVNYEFVLSAAEALIVTLVVVIRNIGHLPERGILFSAGIEMYITFLLVIFAADMLALLISSIVKTETTAMTVMPFVLIIQLVMSGMIFELKGLTKAISALTLSRWGLNAICAIANVNDMGFFHQAEGCESTLGNMLLLWFWLILFAALYIVLSILVLERIDADKR